MWWVAVGCVVGCGGLRWVAVGCGGLRWVAASCGRVCGGICGGLRWVAALLWYLPVDDMQVRPI